MTPADIAKGALRRLAQARQEPNPENYARAYAEEAGQPPPPDARNAGAQWAGLIDRVVRGLIHWESLDPRPPLPPFYAWPTVAVAEGDGARRPRRDPVRADVPSTGGYREAYEAVLNSTSWRVTAPLRRVSLMLGRHRR